MNYSNESLNTLQKQQLLSRFPINNAKLPYETTSTNTSVSNEYDMGMAISYGKRAYAWFTYYQNKDVCCIMELNRDNMIGSSIYFIETDFPTSFSLGTILSGTIYEDENSKTDSKTNFYFIVENIFVLKGQTLSTIYSERIQSLYQFFQELFTHNGTSIPFVCPVMWNYDSKKNSLDEIPAEYSGRIQYTIRYIQYRSSNQILPLLNISINKKPIWSPIIPGSTLESVGKTEYVGKTESAGKTESVGKTEYVGKTDASKDVIPTSVSCTNASPIPVGSFDYSKPIYKQTVLFMVMAEIHHDVYFLYLKNKEGKWIKFQHALILNFKTSVWMNGLFRNIKENQNLDYMEESEDEDDFEDLREDKYVDLQKQLMIECVFSPKFKLWTPVRVIDSTSVSNLLPSIEQFVFSNTGRPNSNYGNRPNNRPSHSFHNSGQSNFRKPSNTHYTPFKK
jgi:hypothetical protein